MMKRKQAVAAGLALCLVLCHIPGIRTEDFEPEIMTAAQVYTLYEDLDDTGRTYPEYERGYER